MYTKFYDYISFSTVFFPFIFLGRYFVNKNIDNLFALAGLFVVNLTNEALKYKVFKTNRRPTGAYNCNLMNNDGNQSEKPGMPSSHAAITTYFVLTLLYLNYKEQQKINPYLNIFLLVYFYLVLLSRHKKLCHSLQQLLAGFILGLLFFIVQVKLMFNNLYLFYFTRSNCFSLYKYIFFKV